MDTDKAAILVDVIRTEGGPPQYRDRAAIPVKEIVSVAEVEPSGRPEGARERCRVNLSDAPVKNEAWVFRPDADDEPGTRAVWVEQTLSQVTALMDFARSENRTVTTEDLGEAVAAAWRRGTGKPIVAPTKATFSLRRDQGPAGTDKKVP